MKHPLANITVVALEQAVAAPFATRQLADLGARVIKIERPDGGDFGRHYDKTAHGLCSHFAWCNRSKESLTLNLKTTGAKIALDKLLSNADVFVQNLAPGAVDRLGFSTERLRRDYPKLIICNISGFGATGPFRDKKAYDALVQAEVGLFSITGTEETPSKAGIAVADIAAAMYAYSGILTALIARGQTGEGMALEVSLFESLAEWMGYPMYYTMGGTAPKRSGTTHAAIAPYGIFATGDGASIMLSIQNQREWEKFCAIVLQEPCLAGDERFSTNVERVANRTALRQEIDNVFGRLPVEAVLARLDKAQIANARSRTVQDFLEHPQLQARQRWTTVDSSVGMIPTLLPAVTIEGVAPVMDPIPALGEHTNDILTEFGYRLDEIEELREKGVI